MEQYESCEKSLRRAIQLDSKLKGPGRLLEKLLQTRGSGQELADIEAVNRQREKTRDNVIEAGALAKAGDWVACEELCKKILAEDKDNAGAKELMIERALETGRARWAEELARSLIRKMPEQSKWWLRLGAALSRQDQLVEAEEAVQHVLNIDAEKPEALMLLGDIYSKDNRFADALAQYDLVLASSPDRVSALSQKATALKTLGRQAGGHRNLSALYSTGWAICRGGLVIVEP
jgi:predicted Zn-dependent protease